MAVVCQAFNIIVQNDILDQKYPGGVEGYKENVPNRTFCSDGKLTRVGFMRSEDVNIRVEHLESYGLIHIIDNEAGEICIIDERDGAPYECRWLMGGKNDTYDLFVWLNGEEAGEIFVPEGFIPDTMGRAIGEEMDKHELIDISEDGTEEYLIEGESQYVGVAFDYSLEEGKKKTTKILKHTIKDNKKDLEV